MFLSYFSLFRLTACDQTIAEFSKLHQTLNPFYQASGEHLDVEILQKIINNARSNPGWSNAHHAVAAKFERCLATPAIRE